MIAHHYDDLPHLSLFSSTKVKHSLLLYEQMFEFAFLPALSRSSRYRCPRTCPGFRAEAFQYKLDNCHVTVLGHVCALHVTQTHTGRSTLYHKASWNTPAEGRILKSCMPCFINQRFCPHQRGTSLMPLLRMCPTLLQTRSTVCVALV